MYLISFTASIHMKTYIRNTRENVHIRFTATWKYIVPISFFVFLYPWMSSTAEVLLYLVPWKHINDGHWTLFIIIIIVWEIHLLLCLWLKTLLSTTEQNLAHTWIMVMVRLEPRSLRYQEETQQFWPWRHVWPKWLCLRLGIKVFWVHVSSLL